MKTLSNPQPKLVISWLFILASMATPNVYDEEKVECKMETSSHKAYYTYDDRIANEIENLHSINSSITHLARLLITNIDNEDPTTFSLTQDKVAPMLFEALTTETEAHFPKPVLVSFTGSNGVFVSYFSTGRGTIATLYSNGTLAYTQPALSSEPGKLVGEVQIVDQSADLFLQAENLSNGYTSIGRRLCGGLDPEILVIRTIFFEELNGAVSLGFPIEEVMDLVSERRFSAGELNGGDGEKMMLSVCRDVNNGDFIDDLSTVGSEDAQCASVDNSSVDSSPSLTDLLKNKWNSVVGTLMEMIQQHSGKVLLILVVLIVALLISVTFGANLAVELTRTKKKFKEYVQDAERKLMNKSTSIATICHDIRASLAGLTGLIQLSYSEVVRSELEKNFNQMTTCVRDLLGMLNPILDSSKIEAGKMQLEESEIDLPKLLEDVVDLFHPVGMKKSVDVVLDLTDGSLNRYPIVKGDRLKLNRVITNLLSNAVKFTAEGHISVRAWARKPILEDSTMISSSRFTSSTPCSSFFFWKSKRMAVPENEESKSTVKQDPNCMEYVFEVEDTGSGIPKDKWKTVFENYVQVKETAATVGGTGLGLGIVQSMIRLMGGDIEIVDKQFGEKGCCFKFNIFLTNCANHLGNAQNQDESTSNPVLDDDCTIPMDAQSNYNLLASSAGPNNPKSSLVVLLIQNEGRRKMIQSFLESLGIMVVEAKEAEVIPSIIEEVNRNQSLSEPCLREANNPSVPLHVLQAPVNFVLLMVDTNAGEFSKLKDSVARSKELSMKSSCKVIWLETGESRYPHSRGRNEREEIVPVADYITSKPLHGSRLFEVIRFLPEFSGQSKIRSQHQGMADQTEEVHFSPTKVSEETGPSGHSVLPVDRLSCSSTPLFGKRVLIAEDDRLLMLVASRTVMKMGANVEICDNGQEAVDLVRKGLADQRLSRSSQPPFDYILMDCQMPLLDGYEATRLIRQEEALYNLHIPIIALTAHVSGAEQDRIFEAGMDYHLGKPLQQGKLIEAIKFIEKKEDEL